MRVLSARFRKIALIVVTSLSPISGGCGEEGAKTEVKTTASAPPAAVHHRLAEKSEGAAVSSAPSPAPPPADAAPGTEKYAKLVENAYRDPAKQPLSTFSVDVDTASYSNVRRFLNQGVLPPKDAVRVEELINYFPYAYPQPTRDDEPFSVNVEVSRCPWDEGHRLAKIGLKGREIANRPAAGEQPRLPDRRLGLDDGPRTSSRWSSRRSGSWSASSARTTGWRSWSMPGSSGLVLPSTSCQDQARVIAVAGESCRRGAPPTAGRGSSWPTTPPSANFIKGGTNRVILCTDGDFNVGVTSRDALLKLIEAKAKSGVFLSVLGFGMGNYKDADDQPARRQGERQRGVHRLDPRGGQGPGRADGRDAPDDRQGRQDPGRVQPGQGRLVSPDRLRGPHSSRLATSTTTRRTPARSARATPSPRSTRSSPPEARPEAPGVDPLRYAPTTPSPPPSSTARPRHPSGPRDVHRQAPPQASPGGREQADRLRRRGRRGRRRPDRRLPVRLRRRRVRPLAPRLPVQGQGELGWHARTGRVGRRRPTGRGYRREFLELARKAKGMEARSTLEVRPGRALRFASNRDLRTRPVRLSEGISSVTQPEKASRSPFGIADSSVDSRLSAPMLIDSAWGSACSGNIGGDLERRGGAFRLQDQVGQGQPVTSTRSWRRSRA